MPPIGGETVSAVRYIRCSEGRGAYQLNLSQTRFALLINNVLFIVIGMLSTV